MGKLFFTLAIGFIILVLVNLIFIFLNLVFLANNGLDALIKGTNFIETIYLSQYLKWILLYDFVWLSALFVFLLKRKNFMTDPRLHYLTYGRIDKPRICVIIPAFNEELSIDQVINDFKNQEFVEYVLVIDNHSTDNTVDIAKRNGTTVISKEKNMGYAHSWWLGFNEALKLDANIIVLVDSDGTFSGYDLKKMIPYLDNCDMVIGNRLVQSLTEKNNQNNAFLVWGNSFIAKLLQLKYFSIRHLGIIQVNDVGCSFRCFRSESLKKIINEFTVSGTDELAFGCNYITVGMFTTTKAIEKNLKIVEIPITFKKRIGKSKTNASKYSKALHYGLYMIWYILKS